MSVGSTDESHDEEDEEKDDNYYRKQTHSIAAQLEADPFLVSHTRRVQEITEPIAPCAARLGATQVLTDVPLLTSRMSAILSWDRLVSYLVIYGRSVYSAEQYEDLRAIVAGAGRDDDEHALQPYKTIRRHMRINLGAWCFPRSSVKYVEDIELPRGAQRTTTVLTDLNEKKPALACVRMVLPSEWAKLDIATYTFYSDVYEHPDRGNPEFLSVETAPIVHSRAAFVGHKTVLWSLFCGAPCVTNEGDTVEIPCAAMPGQAEHSRNVANDWFRAEPRTTDANHVRGV